MIQLKLPLVKESVMFEVSSHGKSLNVRYFETSERALAWAMLQPRQGRIECRSPSGKLIWEIKFHVAA